MKTLNILSLFLHLATFSLLHYCAKTWSRTQIRIWIRNTAPFPLLTLTLSMKTLCDAWKCNAGK